MCRQQLRNEVPEAGKPALSCNHSLPAIIVRILHVFRLFCSRSISVSLILLLHWRIYDGTSSFLGKRQQSVLVEPCCGLVSKRAGRKHFCPKRGSFDGKFDAVSSPSGECGRSAQACGRFAEIAPEKAGTAAEERQSHKPKRPRRNRCSVRTDSGAVALQTLWGMHIEAMNWSGIGHAEYAAALSLSPPALRIWRDRLEQSGNEMDWRNLLHPSARAQLSSAANCARRKYRLTPEAADGRSNRRRFNDKQKRSIVQETEKPGASVAQICRRHGVGHQHGVPLAGRLRPERSKGSASRNGGAGRWHDE
jgi:transposase